MRNVSFVKNVETEKNLDSEVESLIKIKEKMKANYSTVWRYATGIGDKEDASLLGMVGL